MLVRQMKLTFQFTFRLNTPALPPPPPPLELNVKTLRVPIESWLSRCIQTELVMIPKRLKNFVKFHRLIQSWAMRRNEEIMIEQFVMETRIRRGIIQSRNGILVQPVRLAKRRKLIQSISMKSFGVRGIMVMEHLPNHLISNRQQNMDSEVLTRNILPES